MFKNIFTPLKIKNLVLNNRIVITAHSTHFANQGKITQRHIDYYEERAKGGVGLIVLEAQSIHPTCVVVSMIRNWDDKFIDGGKKIVDAVHKHNTKIFAQLWHSGRQSKSSTNPVVAPSPIPCPLNREMPKELEIEEIQELINAFGNSARRCKEAGFDGIEVHGAHGYLIQQFMSAYSNKRKDKYGGSFENRMRFPLEIIDKVRENVGEDYIVGFRLCGDELVEGGITLDEAKKTAKLLEDTKKIDYISVTIGNYQTLNFWIQPMYFPLASITYLAQEIREIVNLPVICIGRINDIGVAERVLEEGQADLVGMTRAHIAEPEIVKKAKEERVEDIRPCIGCNQGCWERAMEDKPITCTGNPEVGKERAMKIMPAEKKKKVFVAGGGPAGLEVSRVLALRGHKVILYEKEDELGGQLMIAAKAPGRENFADLIKWLKRQIENLDVEINLSKSATADIILSQNPDTVVIATGASPLIPDVKGVNNENVVTCWDVLLGKVETGNNVLVVDEEAHMQAVSVADFLLDKGKNVKIITGLSTVGMDIEINTYLTIFTRLFQKGVKIYPFSGLKEVLDGSVKVINPFNQKACEIENIDTVVLALGGVANDSLYYSLKGKVKEIYQIGDCVAPRKAIKAIAMAARVGRIV